MTTSTFNKMMGLENSPKIQKHLKTNYVSQRQGKIKIEAPTTTNQER